mgnify:CR=1 FL=1
MKGLYIAVGVLLAVVILVGWNAVYVHHVTDELLNSLDALPEEPDPNTTPDQIARLRKQLDSHMTLLGLSVSYNVLDRAEEALYTLEAHARTGDVDQYATSLMVLRDLMRDFARLERIDGENILRLMPLDGARAVFYEHSHVNSSRCASKKS